jgi:hypothetical protein
MVDNILWRMTIWGGKQTASTYLWTYIAKEIDTSSDKGWTVLADLTDKLQKVNGGRIKFVYNI